MTREKLNIFLSTLNFVLCFVGYPLATSLFLPVTSDVDLASQNVTIPYRIFALSLSLTVLILNSKRNNGLLSYSLLVFIFYWTILIIRLFYDIVIRTDVHLTESAQLWLYVFGICLPAIFSIIKSFKFIDLDKSLLWVFIATTIILVLSLLTNQALLLGSDDRQEANIAFSTIQFGHFGTSSLILCIFLLINNKIKSPKKIIIYFVVLLSIFCMLRAGSRGPVLALFIVIFFWIFSSGKNLIYSTLTLIIVFILTILFIDQILTFMGDISPVIEDRLRLSIYEGDTSDRDPLYESAINYFLESPIIGKQFAFFDLDGTFLYSHNLILDSLMGLGIIGGISILYILGSAIKISNFLIKTKDSHFWLALLLIQQIIFNMTSSAFYYNQLLSALLVFIFMYKKEKQLNTTNPHQ